MLVYQCMSKFYATHAAVRGLEKVTSYSRTPRPPETEVAPLQGTYESLAPTLVLLCTSALHSCQTGYIPHTPVLLKHPCSGRGGYMQWVSCSVRGRRRHICAVKIRSH